MKRIVFLLIYISFNLGSFCQESLPDRQAGLDSLWNVWNDTKQHDTIRLKAIQSISHALNRNQPDSSFVYAQLQYDFAKSKGYKKQMAGALNTQGVSFYWQGDYTRAIDYYTRCLTIREEIGDQKGIANSLNNIGLIYSKQGDYAHSIDYYTRSLAIEEELGNKKGIAASLNNIGIIYKTLGDYTKAIDYYTRSLTIRKEIGDKKGIATSLNNNGIIYMDKGDLVSANDYYTRSLAIKEELGDKNGIARRLSNIGDVYINQGNFSKALDYYTRSLLIRKELGDKIGIATSLINIGNLNQEQGDYANAIEYCADALSIAQELGTPSEIKRAANSLYESYKATAKYNQALEMYELYVSMRDSIASETNQKEVIRQEYKYEYEKQAVADSVKFEGERIIQQTKLRESRTQFFASIAVLILVLFIAIIFFRGREKQKKLNTELKNTQAQLVQSEKMASLGQLAAGVAHEINNPINFIKTADEGIKLNVHDVLSINAEYEKVAPNKSAEFDKIKEKFDFDIIKEELEEQTASALDGVIRTSEVVEGLRSFTSLDEDIKKFVDIHSNINNSLAVLSHTMPESIKIIKEFGNIPEVDCYPGKMNQVFVNFITNALEAIVRKNIEEGIIRISTAVEDGFLNISFEDNGEGISDDIKNKIFDPFFTTKDAGEGKGLGLSIAHGIIEEHGGEITVRSEHGKGSEFIISLKM